MAAASAHASGLAGRYAGALFDLARDAGALDQIADDLKGLKALMAESADLTRLIESPVLSRDDQSRALTTIATKASAHDLTRRFLGLLAERRRAFALPDVADAFSGMLAEDKGETTAEVVSAIELTKAQQDALKGKIAQSAGKTVTMNLSVDPSLLGGLIVRIGSTMIDASLKTKLNQLSLAMKQGAA